MAFEPSLNTLVRCVLTLRQKSGIVSTDLPIVTSTLRVEYSSTVIDVSV